MLHTQSKLQDVKALVQSRGGWRSVIGAYPNLLDAMSSRKEKPCPKTGQGKTKFRPFKDWEDTGGAWHNDIGALPDGIELLSWYTDKSKGEVLNEIVSICGGNLPQFTEEDRRKFAERAAQCKEISEEEAKTRAEKISAVWKKATPIKGTAAEVYLLNRGLKGDLSVFGRNLMFHPALKYAHKVVINAEEKVEWKSHPALLAVVRDGNGVGVTLHRTFLNADGSGKAEVEEPKMMMSQPRDLDGGYIELDKPTDGPLGKIIGVCEGLETGLSIREATGCPMRVGISDQIMKKMRFEPEIKHVIIWADHDKPTERKPQGAGLAAANELKARLESEGVDVVVLVPNMFGREKMDWNDVYQEFGVQGFEFYLEPQYRVYTGVEL